MLSSKRKGQMLIGALCVSVFAVLFMTGTIKIVTGKELLIQAPLETKNYEFIQPIATTGLLLVSPYGAKDHLLKELKEANYSIQIWCYQITDPEVINVLKSKAAQGVTVQVILENQTLGEGSKDYLKFLKATRDADIQVQTDEQLGTVYVHAKTILIDGQQAIISTANFTYPGFMANREYRYFTNNAPVVLALQKLFEADWKAERAEIKFPSALRFCPFTCREQLHAFIDSAKQSIDIEAQYLEDPELITQLTQKIEQGINVRIVVGKYQERSQIKSLQDHVHILRSPNIHAKNILIDGQYLYVGSMNLSSNAIGHNREIGVVSNDHKVLEKFTRQFTEDRE